MVIKWTKINIPIAGKLVTKKDKANYYITELEKIENWYIDVEKQLKKREAYQREADFSETDLTRLFTNYDEMLMTDDSNLLAYSSNLDSLIPKGHLKKLTVNKKSIAQYIDSYYSPQTCVNQDLEATVYLDKDSKLYLTVTRGAQIVKQAMLVSSPSARPQIVSYNSNFLITFTYNDKLWLITYLSRTNTVSNVTEICDLDTSNYYSLSLVEGKPIVSYIDTSTQLSLLSLLSPATQIQFPYYPQLLDLNSDILTFAGQDGYANEGVYQFEVSPLLQVNELDGYTSLTSVNISDLTQITGDRNTVWLEEVPAATPYLYKIDRQAPVPSDELVLLNHFLVSSLFDDKLIVLPNTNDKGTYITIDSDLNVEAVLLPEAAGSYTNSYIATGVELLEANYLSKASQSTIALREKTRIESENSELYTEKGITSLEIADSSDRFQTLQADNLLISTGACLKQYDGVTLSEIGFITYPEIIGSATIQTGGSIKIGTYAYCLTYEALDNKGNVIRSTPSFYTSVAIVADNSKVTFVASSLQLSSFSAVKLCLYRTESLGQIFYKVAEIDNDTSTISLSIVDKLVDTDIVSREMLYTTGGTYENSFPPAAKFIQEFQNRIFLVSAENPNRLWFSKKIKTYKEGLAFSSLNTIELQKDETITALANLDDKLVIFTKDSIKILTGEGPADNGTGEQYAHPYSLTISTGTSNQRSICKYRDGIVFQAKDGFFQLSRSLQISELGESVKLYKDWTVLQTLVREEKQQIRLLIEKDNIQKVLVYSFEYQRWSVFQDLPAIDSEVLVNDKLYCLGNNELLVETTNQTDESIKSIWESGWIQLNINKQSFQKIRKAILLIENKALVPASFKIEALYDWKVTPEEQFEFTLDEETTYGASSDKYGTTATHQREFNFKRQKCQAFKIRITEESRGSNIRISAITLEVGEMVGLNKVPTSSKVIGENNG